LSVADITLPPMTAAVITYIGGVARWDPDARGRLERAALQLYLERGYDDTTVADIAAEAGLTERTFFRHFADKREVLFGGSALLRDLMVKGVAAAPSGAAPIDAVANALEAAAPLFVERGDLVRQRQRVIAANPDLQERELIKLAALATALAEALRARGVKEPAASLAGEAGIAVFRVAFDRWVTASKPRDLTKVIRESFEELRTVTSAGS